MSDSPYDASKRRGFPPTVHERLANISMTTARKFGQLEARIEVLEEHVLTLMANKIEREEGAGS